MIQKQQKKVPLPIPAGSEVLLNAKFDFDELATSVWNYQLQHNDIVKQFCDIAGIQSPLYLPIAFFKHKEIKTGSSWKAEKVFESSGTTGKVPSRHFVRDLKRYESLALEGFLREYGTQKRLILALLPGYLEREGASLVYMVNHWIRSFGIEGSGFYLDDWQSLDKQIKTGIREGKPILLIGVTHALLDFSEAFPQRLPEGSIVMETGGMKGKRKELVRSELHNFLKKRLGTSQIHSEYGMTELLSQAYAKEDGKFLCPPWMRIEIVDINSLSRKLPNERVGRICITDLGNVHSCSFIATDDIGLQHSDGSFEVLGRIDNSELRGCNLLYT